MAPHHGGPRGRKPWALLPGKVHVRLSPGFLIPEVDLKTRPTSSLLGESREEAKDTGITGPCDCQLRAGVPHEARWDAQEWREALPVQALPGPSALHPGGPRAGEKARPLVGMTVVAVAAGARSGEEMPRGPEAEWPAGEGGVGGASLPAGGPSVGMFNGYTRWQQ